MPTEGKPERALREAYEHVAEVAGNDNIPVHDVRDAFVEMYGATNPSTARSAYTRAKKAAANRYRFSQNGDVEMMTLVPPTFDPS